MDEATRDEFYRALTRYNRGDYLTSQEMLEDLFGRTSPEEQGIVRAMMSLACAMHLHFNRGGGRGVENLLRQGLVHLDDNRPSRLGVEVDGLFDAVQAYLEDLKTRKKPGAGFFDRWLAPRITFRPE